MAKPITVNLNGGYGRVLSATGVISELKKRTNQKINIVTSWPEIFINNPNIDKVYSLNHEYLYDDHIQGTEYKEPEPYKLQGYIDGTIHITEGFALELLGEAKFYQPELFLSEDELEEAKAFVKTSPKPIILFQPFGSMGGKTRDGKKIVNDVSFRSLPIEFAEQIYKKLSKKYQVVIIKEQNQAGIEGWITLPPMPLRKIAALIPFVKGVISVDSSLQHMAATMGKKAIVLWGSTNSKQLGYKTALNIENGTRRIQYNPVRMPGNDYDMEKRYKNVWSYLNDKLLNKIIKEIEDEEITTSR